MGNNPIDSFASGMSAMQQISQNVRRGKQSDKLFDMQMSAYERDQGDARQARVNRKKKRDIATNLVQLQSGQFSAEDVAQWSPEATINFDEVFDEAKQGEALNYVMQAADKVRQGGQLDDTERQPLWEAGSALTVTGVLAPTVTGIKEQAQVLPPLKQQIVSLSEMAAGELMGKKTHVTEEMDPDLFAMFSKAFPAISGGSKAFKGGAGRPVGFYIDATGVDKIQDARVVVLLEGQDKDGKVYRAPMSRRRSSDSDDVLSSKTLGEIHAQVDFAERMSQGLLASLAGFDDATAQRVIDGYRDHAKRVMEEQRKRQQSGRKANAIAGLVGFSDDEKAKLSSAAKSGVDVVKAAEMLIKQNNPGVEVVWRDNVDIGGKPYQVAYDKKSGKQIKAIPQWVKGSSGGGSGSSGAGSGTQGGALKSHIYDEFNESLLKHFVAEYGIDDGVFSSDMMGNEKIDINRYLSKLPEEGRRKFLTAQSLGESLMVTGKYSPIRAAQMAFKGELPGPERMSSHSSGSGRVTQKHSRSAAIAGAKQAIKAGKDKDAVLKRLDGLYPGASAEVDSAPGGGEKPQRQRKPMAKVAPPRVGMSPESSPVAVLNEMSKNIPRDNAIRKGSDAAVRWMLEGLNQIGMATPVGVLASAGQDVVRMVKDFQEWAQHRYDTEGAGQSPEVLAEYAKEKPEEADKIRRTAEMLAAK